MVTSNETVILPIAVDNATRHRSKYLGRLILSTLASIGIFGGISSAVAGTICTVIHSLLTNETTFAKAGSILLIAAVPAMLAGSILIDEIGE